MLTALQLNRFSLPGKAPRPILVRAPNWLGDAVLATAVIHRLRHRLPDHPVWVLAKPTLLPLFAFPGVQALPLPLKAGRPQLWQTVAAIKTLQPRASLLLAPSLRAALEAALAGVPLRLGYADDWRGPLLSHPRQRLAPDAPLEAALPLPDLPPNPSLGALVPFLHWRSRLASRPFVLGSRAPTRRHLWLEALYLADELATALGAPAVDTPLPLPGLPLLPPLEAALADVPGLEKGEAIGIHPGSSGGEARRWPLDHWLELGRRLLDAGRPLILLGGPEEGGLLSALQARLQAHAGRPVSGFFGKNALSVMGLAVLTRQLTCLVCPDSGPMHLAAAAGGRVVALFGPTLPGLSGPLGGGHRCLEGPALPCRGCHLRTCPFGLPCLRGLEPEAVWEALQALLATPRRGVGGGGGSENAGWEEGEPGGRAGLEVGDGADAASDQGESR